MTFSKAAFLRSFTSLFIIFSFSIRAEAELERLYENAKSPLVKVIQSAQTSLDIEIYTMKDTKVFKALKEAMARGVMLRIVQEPNPVGDDCFLFESIMITDNIKCIETKKFLMHVRAHGGIYVPYDKNLCSAAGTSCFQHGKIVIADGNRLLLSTGNFNASNLCDSSEDPEVCYRDYTVVTEDPKIIKTIQTIFKNDLVGKKTNLSKLLGTAAAARVTVSPYSLDPLLSFIGSAKETIQLENQYLKSPELNDALMRAAKRGVKVFALVSSACAYGKPKDGDISYFNQVFAAFDKVGIRTRVFSSSIKISGHLGRLHSKAILVDGARAWVGSVNGSTTSLSLNREYGIFTSEPIFVKNLSAFLYADYTHEKTQTWKQSLKCTKDIPIPYPLQVAQY